MAVNYVAILAALVHMKGSDFGFDLKYDMMALNAPGAARLTGEGETTDGEVLV